MLPLAAEHPFILLWIGTMKKIERAMLKAIDNCPASYAGRIFSGGNTTVDRWHSGVYGTIGYDAGFSVTLYKTEIAKWSSYDPSTVALNHGWFKTVTTKSRINVILDYLYDHRFGLYQCLGEWYIAEYSSLLDSHAMLDKYRWDDRAFILDTRRVGVFSVLTVA